MAKVRHVSMNDAARDILRGLASRMRSECIFPNRAGKPMSPATFINRYLRPTLERAEITDFH